METKYIENINQLFVLDIIIAIQMLILAFACIFSLLVKKWYFAFPSCFSKISQIYRAFEIEASQMLLAGKQWTVKH